MSRFVLRYQGAGRRPDDVVQRIRGLPNANVLEDTGRMLLIEGAEDRLRQLLEPQRDWVLAPEQTVPVPDTRRKVRQPPPSPGVT